MDVDGDLKLGLVDSVPADEDTGPEHIEVDLFDRPSNVHCDIVLREFRGHIRRLRRSIGEESLRGPEQG